MLYVTVPAPWQRVDVAVLKAVIVTVGVTVIEIVDGAQLLFVTTLMLPEVAVPKSTTIERVFCPEVIVAPVGTLQV